MYASLEALKPSHKNSSWTLFTSAPNAMAEWFEKQKKKGFETLYPEVANRQIIDMS